MIKLFGKDNDLRTEEGMITKAGYIVMLTASVFGLCVFLAVRHILAGALRDRNISERGTI